MAPTIAGVDLAQVVEELAALRARVAELEAERAAGELLDTFRTASGGSHVALVPRDLGTPPGTLKALLDERGGLVTRIMDDRRQLERLASTMRSADARLREVRAGGPWPRAGEKEAEADRAYREAAGRHRALLAEVEAAERRVEEIARRIERDWLALPLGEMPFLGIPQWTARAVG